MLNLHFGTATHSGHRRELNEDSLVAFEGIAAVADGMGGHAAGEVASQLAISSMEAVSADASPLKPENVIRAISDANDAILRVATTDPNRKGMGTTLAGLAVVHVGGSDHWMVFNVGDSRVYRVIDRVLEQVTVDHSEVEELLAAGKLSAADAKSYSRRHVVTRSLGTGPKANPDIWMFPPTDGERFLICSDGLPLELDDDEIARNLLGNPDAQHAADALVNIAVSAGGRDNVTAVVVDLMSPVSPTEVMVDTAPRPRDRTTHNG